MLLIAFLKGTTKLHPLLGHDLTLEKPFFRANTKNMSSALPVLHRPIRFQLPIGVQMTTFTLYHRLLGVAGHITHF